jgi:transposase
LAEVMMRGTDRRSGELFSYVDLERRVRAEHPLRAIRETANAALDGASADFSALYSPVGRPSIPPEMLLRALLLQAFYSIRSERQLMERLEYDLLFRWFVGLGVDDPVWDHSTFSTNRDRLLDGDIAAKFLAAVLAQPRVKRLLSSEHFSVDGTLIEAWASMKSFKPKGPGGDDDGGGDDRRNGSRNAPADFKGQKRANATHASTTDADAMLYRKGPGMEARLCFIGHCPVGLGSGAPTPLGPGNLMENRSGLIVGTRLTRVSGHAERLAALDLIAPHGDRPRAITLGADQGYDAKDFVMELRELNVRPHIAQNSSGRRSAIDRRTTRHRGYALSQRVRKRIEEAFGWIKTVAGLKKTRFRGLARVDLAFTFAAAAYNLVRLPKLLAGAPP